MKKKTVLQKLAAAGLALAMVAGTLTGCGGGNDAAGNDNADAAQTEDAATRRILPQMMRRRRTTAQPPTQKAIRQQPEISRIIRQDSRRQLPFRFPFTREGGKAGILQTTTGRNGFRRTLAKSIT